MTEKQEIILIVADKDAIRKLLPRKLPGEGYEYRGAVSFKMRMLGLLVDIACLHQLDIIDYWQ
jgi:DNA-binding NtrC family response regulator